MKGTTSEFVDRALAFSKGSKENMRGQRLIADGLALYFDTGVQGGEIPEHGDDHEMFLAHIEKYLDDAWDHFCTDRGPQASEFRRQWSEMFGEGVPNLKEIAFGGLSRNNAIHAVADLVDTLYPNFDSKWPKKAILTYFLAQDKVLEQRFQAFVRYVYRGGLREMIASSKLRGMSGVFGSTTVRTFCTAGSILITFARVVNEDSPVDAGSFTFVGDEDEKQGKCFGVQSVSVENLSTAISMIDEVLLHWPLATWAPVFQEMREMLFKDDPRVSLG